VPSDDSAVIDRGHPGRATTARSNSATVRAWCSC